MAGARAMGHYIAAVHDYVLMTEPPDRRGWRRPAARAARGSTTAANQFHYCRLSGGGRILFGGYDAVYLYGGPVADRLYDHDATFGRLSQHLFTVVAQREGVRFTHRWGGVIDTCSRFSVCFGSALAGRVVWAAG